MPLLEIQALTHYFGGLRAIHDFSLTLEGGELVGLIGPNGAGKTTVFNILCGFYRPTEGTLLFKGTPIGGLSSWRVTALGMARTFQNIRLWDALTVMDNLCIAQHHRLGYGLFGSVVGGKRYREAERAISRTSEEILDLLGILPCAAELPRNLPYGLRRRVEIARALATRPDLLLLDEPAAGLNAHEIEELIALVRHIRKAFDLTIWLIEHQMRVVMTLCERLQVLDFGETISQGPPEAIQQDPRVIRAYLGEEDPDDA